ncbi:ABC transporter [Nitratireductor aquimarinus]|uniref:ABC transporter substrate-binding protein n=1 Tax=Nitratireductor aquimarinus TaxID=889300 RepID=A0ABU4AQB7_9HYPH|nr:MULTISPECIES: ABC transporter substrate-binding protein [Nitratireductor]MBN8244208.1 ABC transporter [Nitratireductor aquimarinus]MBY6132598.1 ABC transporter substrate-binding protein [Nitratireductor aquimarinus]MCA1304599.1 ABC transporter substrate-binding protein [Nitratireductor aquimarinus]MCV0352265.1 ABC transporter substrate-binding protein [Nitratireductor sp.]MCV0381068.1 ABC transporter substrate-binding protein [Nitratireductor sp.]
MTVKSRLWLRGVVAAGAMALGLGAASAEPIRIGIANFGEHPQLNTAIQGFKDAMAAGGYEEGKDVVYSESHTNFDASLVPQMIAKLQAEGPVLMYTVTTPVSQIAKKALAGSGIPIVFSAVTDPVAAKLVPSWEAGDEGMTGATDLQDVAAVMEFAKKLVPDAKRIGQPYNPGEANDVALLEKVQEAAPAAGFEVVAVGVDNVNDIQQRVASLAGKADVIYTPASNLLQPAIAAVSAAARQAGIPIINSDDGAVSDGVVPASFAVNYQQVGLNAGKIALQILDGTDPKSIPPMNPAYEDHSPRISKKAMAAFGLEIPEELADCNCIVD